MPRVMEATKGVKARRGVLTAARWYEKAVPEMQTGRIGDPESDLPGGSGSATNGTGLWKGDALRGEGDFQAQRNLYSKQPPHRIAGERALFGEPMFVAAARGDFHLSPGSPAIGAASAEEADRDADGAGRPRGQNACIGAFEAAGERETREIHVIPGARDGDGSREKPFGRVQRALDGARPGDTIISYQLLAESTT